MNTITVTMSFGSTEIVIAVEDQTLFATQCYWSGYNVGVETISTDDESGLKSIALSFRNEEYFTAWYDQPELTLNSLKRYVSDIKQTDAYTTGDYITSIGLWNSTLFEHEFIDAMHKSGAMVRVSAAATTEVLEEEWMQDSVEIEVIGNVTEIAGALMWIYFHDTAH